MHPTEAWEISVAVAMPLLASFCVSAYVLTEDNKKCYNKLKNPPWTPPASIIHPVWTFLLVCMGLASWLVWRQGGPVVQAMPLSMYLLMMILLLTWGPLLMRARLLDWALACACMMLAAQLAVFYLFSLVIGPLLTLLLAGPMLVWSFGGVMFTWAMVHRNPPLTPRGQREYDNRELETTPRSSGGLMTPSSSQTDLESAKGMRVSMRGTSSSLTAISAA